uniref:NADH-ubiquinone oxidoreductase chain 6 n=1 Tax=Pseudoniphargus carpalis TaxID=2211484 RepID=A0A345K5R1_9CRUS|nr:NADH dehydrogenase subunit 6 [Pseudoniphargus carpalis]AXH38203.1 NADH dehydrogenase subunit 6 [Pseudoniphargus carpalis]
MTLLLSSLSLVISVMFLLTISPLFLSLLIILQTITLAVIINMITMTSWFSFMLVMIYLSGMMIIFIYVSSMAANELFFPNNFILTPLFISFAIATALTSSYILDSPSDYTNELNQTLTKITIFKTMKMYSKPLFIMTILLILYLLLAMIMVSKNSSFSHGPLRSLK